MDKSFTPSWFKALGLKDVQKKENGAITGATSTFEESQKIIDAYCRALKCDFVKQYLTRHQSPVAEEKIESKSRILWQMKDIHCDGVPFSVLSHHILVCAYDKCSASRNHRQDKATLHNRKKRRPAAGCSARITVKKLRRFVSFPVAPKSYNDSRAKIAMLNKLKQCIDNGEDCSYDITFKLTFPHSSVHKHEFSGSHRNIHPIITKKIRELVDSGTDSSSELKKHLHSYVQNMLQEKDVPPDIDDEAYYPSSRTIIAVVYNYKYRNKTRSLQIEGKKTKLSKPRKRLAKGTTVADANSDNLFRANTLEDVVQAFCAENVEVLPQNCVNEDEISNLGNSVREKLNFLIKQSYSVKDSATLRHILGSLDDIQRNFFTATSEPLISTLRESDIKQTIFCSSSSGIVDQNDVDSGHTSHITSSYEVHHSGGAIFDPPVYSELITVPPDNIQITPYGHILSGMAYHGNSQWTNQFSTQNNGATVQSQNFLQTGYCDDVHPGNSTIVVRQNSIS